MLAELKAVEGNRRPSATLAHVKHLKAIQEDHDTRARPSFGSHEELSSPHTPQPMNKSRMQD